MSEMEKETTSTDMPIAELVEPEPLVLISRCPQCGGEHTQTLSAVYHSGTSVIETESSHSGLAFTGGVEMVPVIGRSKNKGVQQTQLAGIAAPPAQKSAAPVFQGVMMLFVVVGAICAGAFIPLGIMVILAGLIIATIAAIIARASFRHYNTTVWPHLYEEWQTKWLCHRCGNVFVPQLGAPDAHAPQRPQAQVNTPPAPNREVITPQPVQTAAARAIEELGGTPEELVATISKHMHAISIQSMEAEQNIQTCAAAISQLRFHAADDAKLMAVAGRLQREFDSKVDSYRKARRLYLVVGLAALVLIILFGIWML